MEKANSELNLTILSWFVLLSTVSATLRSICAYVSQTSFIGIRPRVDHVFLIASSGLSGEGSSILSVEVRRHQREQVTAIAISQPSKLETSSSLYAFKRGLV